jgi:hypothetical protein
MLYRIITSGHNIANDYLILADKMLIYSPALNQFPELPAAYSSADKH